MGASSQHDPTGCEFTGESPCSISEGKAYIFNPKNGSLVRTLRLPREDVPGPTEDNPDGGCHVLSSSAQGGTYVMNGANGSPLKSLELPKTCEQPSSRQNRAPALGWSLAAPGDLNADGDPDYVGGAPFFDIPPGEGSLQRGQAGYQGLLFTFLSKPGSLPTPCEDLGSG